MSTTFSLSTSCGERFVGLWAPVVLTGDVERLQDSVWCKELPEVELGGAA